MAETEGEGILGMDFLSQADSHIDIVKNQASINEEVFDCSDFKNQPFSSRCVVRRSTTIEPNTGDCPSYYSKALYQLRHAIDGALSQLTFAAKGLWWMLKRTEWFLCVFSMFLTKFATWLPRLWLLYLSRLLMSLHWSFMRRTMSVLWAKLE